MNKKIREKLYEETHHNCGYCWKNLDSEGIKSMQVDHIVPKRVVYKETNDFKNLLCVCRSCNHYKGALQLHMFRELIETIHERIKKEYIVKVAVDYELIEFHEWNKIFYFEKIGLDKYKSCTELTML